MSLEKSLWECLQDKEEIEGLDYYHQGFWMGSVKKVDYNKMEITTGSGETINIRNFGILNAFSVDLSEIKLKE